MEDHSEPRMLIHPIVLDDTWTVNLRSTIQKEKSMISRRSKEFILKQFDKDLSNIEAQIGHIQWNLAHYGKQLHDRLEEKENIKNAAYDLKNSTDITDALTDEEGEDES